VQGTKRQESTMKLGFIGLGRMGRGMAESLLSAGHELTVYNRTHERAEPFRKWGARVAATPKEAAHDAEAVVTMLADDAAVEVVTFGHAGLLSGLAPAQGKGEQDWSVIARLAAERAGLAASR
jgi:3-hydroxyisobutyrate dehydrogenase-like beta-hydroxyacid dehydrogenase